MPPSGRLSRRMLDKIADAGLLIAALDARDQNHGWARQVLESESPPCLVCEPVLAEVSASVGTPLPVVEMPHRGDLEIAFTLGDNGSEALALAKKYRDQGMDLADACVIRMSELLENSVVYTVDRKDFSCHRADAGIRFGANFPRPHSFRLWNSSCKTRVPLPTTHWRICPHKQRENFSFVDRFELKTAH